MLDVRAVALAILALFCLMVVCMMAGRRIGLRGRARDPVGAKAGLGTVDGAVFSLLGLLLAFTFGGAASRFHERHELIVEEANAIGTAYLRIDLLPAAAQPELREDFRRYLDARLDYYGDIGNADHAGSMESVERYGALQRKIWNEAIAACKQLDSAATTSLVAGSINSMIDITSTRLEAMETHPPAVIFAGLALLMLAASLLAGYGMAEGMIPSRFHMVLFPLILCSAVFVIVDIEFPRAGFIRVDKFDHFLIDLRVLMR